MSVDSAGLQGNGDSHRVVVTPDGRYVAFSSRAGNLVPADTNPCWDIFVRDVVSGTTERVSVDSLGGQGNGDCHSASISADGRYVAFASYASNLVTGDANGFSDVFVHDRQSHTTIRASVSSNGQEGDGDSLYPTLSADGRYVAFTSYAKDLTPSDPDHLSDVFVHDLQTGATTLVSTDSNGQKGNDNSYSSYTSISSDGRFVAFQSYATNLVPSDTNGVSDVFVHDLLTGGTTRVSVDSTGVQSNDYSSGGSMSGVGRWVAFDSDASNLVPGDTNGRGDVFVYEMATGVMRRVSVDSAGVQGNADSNDPAISYDGRFIAFYGASNNLVPGDSGYFDVFVHDLLSGVTTRASVTPSGAQANGHSSFPSISADGRYVAFDSEATNLVSGDTNSALDTFVRDRGAESAFTPFCSGDGSGTGCPCGNNGFAGHGCENSIGTGGAALAAAGSASLVTDTVQVTSSGELPQALSIVLQGSATVTPTNFGDGLRCDGGALLRLYVKTASGGVVRAPRSGEPSISARSAALGDPIPVGATRCYQVYYRDPSASFCPSPGGSTFNVSNAIAIAWGS